MAAKMKSNSLRPVKAPLAKELHVKTGRGPVYVKPTGLKFGARGKVLPPQAVCAVMSKSDARRVRKFLAKHGRTDMVKASLLPTGAGLDPEVLDFLLGHP